MKTHLNEAIKIALCRTDDILMESSVAKTDIIRAKKILQARDEIENIIKVIDLQNAK